MDQTTETLEHIHCILCNEELTDAPCITWLDGAAFGYPNGDDAPCCDTCLDTMDQTIETLEHQWDAAERRYNRACNPYSAVTMAPMRDAAIATMDRIEAIVNTMSTEDQDRFYGRS